MCSARGRRQPHAAAGESRKELVAPWPAEDAGSSPPAANSPRGGLAEGPGGSTAEPSPVGAQTAAAAPGSFEPAGLGRQECPARTCAPHANAFLLLLLLPAPARCWSWRTPAASPTQRLICVGAAEVCVIQMIAQNAPCLGSTSRRDRVQGRHRASLLFLAPK